MPVPDFQSLMLPTLKALAGQGEMAIRDVRARVAKTERLTLEDQRLRVPSGRQTLLANRVAWAMLYMYRAGLVTKPRRGVYLLTADGEGLLKQQPERIDMKFLRDYPAYAEWKKHARGTGERIGEGEKTGGDNGKRVARETPEEAFLRAAGELSADIEAQILEKVIAAAPEFLERVVVDLLIAMGYGGGDSERGEVTGGSGDGGIDGTIREDSLGLDEIYVQAKKYAVGNDVGVGPLRNFAGALVAAGTTKGVFVTTARFTRGACDFIEKNPQRIVLIDGKELARLMVQNDVGVRRKATYEIKRIDEDYFDSDEF